MLLNILRFTAPFDFSGSPTLTLPNGLDAAGMPLSMQLVESTSLRRRAYPRWSCLPDRHQLAPAPTAGP